MLALDRSLRTSDPVGRLFVESCNISKAMVCEYLGKEIPQFQELGLDPNRIYHLYRDPAELEAAAPSFRSQPLLIKHKAVSADEPAQELVVGTTGDQVKFEPPYLKASIAVWTAEAVKAVETRDQEQLSCGYHYTPDMTPGFANGEPYDGVMRNLIGNHVALVAEGRCGPDVVVPDELPPELKMRRSKFAEALKPFLAKDADPIALDAALVAALDAKDDDDETEEEKAARLKREREEAKDAKARDAKAAKDEKDDDDKKAKDKKGAKDAAAEPDAPKKAESGAEKPAKDSAITQEQLDAAVAAGVKQAREEAKELHAARDEVAPICGVVALDSADDVRAFALKQLKVDIEGVPPAAYKALLSVAKQKSTPAPRIAMDAAAAMSASAIWPELSRIHA